MIDSFFALSLFTFCIPRELSEAVRKGGILWICHIVYAKDQHIVIDSDLLAHSCLNIDEIV